MLSIIFILGVVGMSKFSAWFKSTFGEKTHRICKPLFNAAVIVGTPVGPIVGGYLVAK